MNSVLLRFHERLTRSDRLQAVDLIFVMAGRMERKQYGLDLFHSGVTSRLVISVGRFEVSKMECLQLEKFQELLALRNSTPPEERHFFVTVDKSGVQFEKAKLARWNTYGEALALRHILKNEKVQRVMVVSTDIHLRRVALAFSKVFRDTSVQFLYCAVPSVMSSSRRERWWTRSADRRYLFKETVKLGGYQVILSMPNWAISWLMRLKVSNSHP